MFGGFQNGWSTGLTQFSDLSDRALSIRKTVEAGLQDSGLLGPGEVPSNPGEVNSGTHQLQEVMLRVLNITLPVTISSVSAITFATMRPCNLSSHVQVLHSLIWPSMCGCITLRRVVVEGTGLEMHGGLLFLLQMHMNIYT
jgi:hypothetical protein